MACRPSKWGSLPKVDRRGWVVSRVQIQCAFICLSFCLSFFEIESPSTSLRVSFARSEIDIYFKDDKKANKTNTTHRGGRKPRRKGEGATALSQALRLTLRLKVGAIHPSPQRPHGPLAAVGLLGGARRRRPGWGWLIPGSHIRV